MFLMPNGFDGFFTSGPPDVVPFFLLMLGYILDYLYLCVWVFVYLFMYLFT